MHKFGFLGILAIAATSQANEFTNWTYQQLTTTGGALHVYGNAPGGYIGTRPAVVSGGVFSVLPGVTTGRADGYFESQIGAPSATTLLKYAVGTSGASNGLWFVDTGAFSPINSAGSGVPIGINENGWFDAANLRFYPASDPAVVMPAGSLEALSSSYVGGQNTAGNAVLYTVPALTTIARTAGTSSEILALTGRSAAGYSTSGASKFMQLWTPSGFGVGISAPNITQTKQGRSWNGGLVTGVVFGTLRRAGLWNSLNSEYSPVLGDLAGPTTESFAEGMVTTDTSRTIYGYISAGSGIQAAKWSKPIVHEPYSPIYTTEFTPTTSYAVGNLMPQNGFLYSGAGGSTAWTVMQNVALGLAATVKWNPALASTGQHSAWRSQTIVPSTTAPKYVVSAKMYIRSKGANPNAHNAGGLEIWNGGVRYAQVKISGDGSILLTSNTANHTPLAAFAPDVWHNINLVADFVAAKVYVRVDGEYIDSIAFNPGPPAWQVTDGDLFTEKAASGTEEIYFSRYNYGIDNGQRMISGRVQLLDWPYGGSSTLSFYTPSGLVATKPIGVTSEGGFEASVAIAPGNYKVIARTPGWISRAQNITITELGCSTINIGLPNGDIKLDDVVDLTDYIKIVTYFNMTSTSPGWSTPDGDGVTPAFTDLNGDGVIDLSDYIIVVTNFNLFGDTP
ncbi:MAG: hypothetical protein K8R88_08520 [Armatimonadetes bacterium]|nr:hypothetical protein [Armatimonadota bacterium]